MKNAIGKNIFPCFPGGFHAARTDVGGVGTVYVKHTIHQLHQRGVIQHPILKTFHFLYSIFSARRQRAGT